MVMQTEITEGTAGLKLKERDALRVPLFHAAASRSMPLPWRITF
jgi:hypothetical protein